MKNKPKLPDWNSDYIQTIYEQFLAKVNTELKRRITKIQEKERDPETSDFVRKMNEKDKQFYELLINFHQTTGAYLDRLKSDKEAINEIATTYLKESEFWIAAFEKGLKEFRFDPTELKTIKKENE